MDGSTLAKKAKNIKSYMPVLESTPAMEGSTLAEKVRTMKSYMPVLESTLAMEGSTLARNTECYFCFVQGKS